MDHFANLDLTHLLTTYGYWAVLVVVAIESMGIPVPGETILLAAAIYSGATQHLALPLVIAAAATGAILGDNLGYLLGRECGFRLLRRYGRLIHLNDRKLKLGIYLFRRHGGKVVFFGRFVPVLRIWAAFLAGTNHMPWRRFLAFNALGGLVWATLDGLGGYLLGTVMYRLTGPIGYIALGLSAITILAFWLFLRRHEHHLADEAERMFPGELHQYVGFPTRDKAA